MFRPHVKIPIGSYVDVPDDTGTLQRWLVIINDNQPQFPMYYILKCNWVLKWVYEGKVYKCECVQRTQSSYNSGLNQGLQIGNFLVIKRAKTVKTKLKNMLIPC